MPYTLKKDAKHQFIRQKDAMLQATNSFFLKGGYRVLHIFVAEINCQGRYDLADRLDNHNSAPNEYISGGGGPCGGTVALLRVGVELSWWRIGWIQQKMEQDMLGGGFKYFLFLPLLGEMIQFD